MSYKQKESTHWKENVFATAYRKNTVNPILDNFVSNLLEMCKKSESFFSKWNLLPLPPLAGSQGLGLRKGLRHHLFLEFP